MKRLKIISSILFILFLASCNFIGDKLEKLDEKKVENDRIQINWYKTSSITTIHEHVEVSEENKTKKVAELNEGGIEGIKIKSDSIIIETKGTGLFYQLDDKVFNYVIVIDTIK